MSGKAAQSSPTSTPKSTQTSPKSTQQSPDLGLPKDVGKALGKLLGR